ncbi:MAG TPA: hypothetical protein PLJ44_02285 [Victivallales bacterium]|nr:hypothetical protein [Victivallales bacterium]
MTQIKAERIVNFYHLMDAAYDFKQSAKWGVWLKTRSFIVKMHYRCGEREF